MTVSTTTNKVNYIGNGVATTFAIPFPFLEKEHLTVRQLLNDIQTERTDWTVSNGNMVFATAPEENAQIVIMREVPLTQETDYRENEILPAETLERDFDKLTMQIQQLKEQADRAVTVDVFEDTDATSLIPSIRQSVSDTAGYAETAREMLALAEQQAGNAALSARTADEQAQLATDKALEAANTLANKADKDVYASKTVYGVAKWGTSAVAETTPAVIVQSWHNGSSWYRVWSDGWIEQGGSLVGATASFTWPKPFSNTNYTVVSTPVIYNSYGVQSVSITEKTNSSISWAGSNYTSTSWYACGY